MAGRVASGKLGVRYLHIDPLRIDLGAVTQSMSNAYAERYRILPVAVARDKLTVATSEPFVRSWAGRARADAAHAGRARVRQPGRHPRYLGEFYNLARSMKKAQENAPGEVSLARNFEQLVALGGQVDANDSHVIHIVDWLWQYAFEQRASDIQSSRGATSASCASASTASCTRCTRSRRRC